MFAGGFSTFALLYCMQPLMPEFSRDFGLQPAAASLSLSVTTVSMAATMLVVGSLSDASGRKKVMALSLFAASLLAVLAAFSPGYTALLALRALQGAALAGVPAIAMTYLSEEVEPSSLGYAMGLYISGNSVGGMGGRIIGGVLADLFDWRASLLGIGFSGLVAALLFCRWLPASRRFRPAALSTRQIGRTLVSQLKDVRLLALYGLGFLLMGSFVTTFNYIGYVLLDRPYSLSQTWVSGIFLVYLTGTFSSTWMGRLADRIGREKTMRIGIGIIAGGALLTLAPPLVAKLFGIALLTFGFFGAHSVASSWVGRTASEHPAQASSLYLFFYYVGSSVSGTVGGVFYQHIGWPGVVAMVSVYMLIALLLCRTLVAGRSNAVSA
ncbi:MFS transporter [Saccharibacillus sacchari]|uniref:MFS transporter n=1 Tax=Saccharibacillus sacchari TaxID=456493 RepID=A0ACC6PH65_9BACL